jgi:hypothetical protein
MSTFENSVTCVTKASARIHFAFPVCRAQIDERDSGEIAGICLPLKGRRHVPGLYVVDGLAIDGAYVILGARSFRT